ncbi:hypothetical protein L6164_021303 [Bauhinia variegata]|uniref:Uncharacterized protein n=1 Tax=Bauhinia variegata TaxID=167791 RepID=A0ACB9MY41_BAUVA|nr:hypothetical protein L6164_021303 [Bauhinia variegata]
MEDGELETDSSSYRVLSSKTLADVVEALIGVYYVEGGKSAANHLMKLIGIQVELDPMRWNEKESCVEGALNVKFKDRGLLAFVLHLHRSATRTFDCLRAAAVNNENFALVAVKHNLHVHLRHGSSALEKQIREFVKEVLEELLKPGFNSFGLGDCKASKVLGDIVESIAGAIFLDSGRDTSVVWKRHCQCILYVSCKRDASSRQKD